MKHSTGLEHALKNLRQLTGITLDVKADTEEEEIQASEISLALIEAHYFYNNMFWEDKNYILNKIEKIKDIPIYIAHGRFDLNTRIISAYKLAEKLNNCELIIVEGVGHSPFTEKMSKVLIKFLEDIKELNYKDEGNG